MENNYYYYTNTSTVNNVSSGLKEETKAINWAKNTFDNCSITVANRNQQKNHIDYIITKGNKEYFIDVKNTKHLRTSRTDEFNSEDYNTLFIEFVNDYGYNGWIYSSTICDDTSVYGSIVKKQGNVLPSKMHYIQFKTRIDNADCYIIVNTADLYNAVKPIVDEDWQKQNMKIILNNPKEYHKIFSRYNYNCKGNPYASRLVALPLDEVFVALNGRYKVFNIK